MHDWGLDPRKVSFFPLFFTPEESLLQIPVETRTNVVTYYGRLEIRKGVVDLADAIPLILRECPEARFRFVGRSLWAPRPRTDMKAFLAQKLAAHTRSVEFLDPVPSSQIPTLLAGTDICVFPSVWESFGYTCLESMSAGRGVVATDPSGMAEMLRDGPEEFGKLAPPRSPADIARAVISLLQAPEERMRLGGGCWINTASAGLENGRKPVTCGRFSAELPPDRARPSVNRQQLKRYNKAFRICYRLFRLGSPQRIAGMISS